MTETRKVRRVCEFPAPDHYEVEKIIDGKVVWVWSDANGNTIAPDVVAKKDGSPKSFRPRGLLGEREGVDVNNPRQNIKEVKVKELEEVIKAEEKQNTGTTHESLKKTYEDETYLKKVQFENEKLKLEIEKMKLEVELERVKGKQN